MAWALEDSTSFNPETVQVQAVPLTPIGTVAIWMKEEVPDGWLECNGQVVNVDLYPELADIMPTTPDYRDKFLQGKNGQEVGTKIEAGLPNITGHWDNAYGNWNAQSVSGALYSGTARHGTQVGRNWGAAHTWKFMLDASKANPVYGKSETVQPPAVVVKYIIKAE